MKKKRNKKDLVFYAFSGVSIALSVCVFGLMRQLTGAPSVKLITDVLVISLLSVLNITVLVLHEIIKEKRK